jgi:hypothetical protein
MDDRIRFSWNALPAGGLFLLLLAGCAANLPPTGTVAGSGGSGGSGGTTPPAPQTTFYVNCSLASDGDGSQSTPWNSLTDANGHTFVAGNSLLLARGTTCNGVLKPQGSGASGSPIVVDAYGTGNVPIVNGGASSGPAVYLNNQQYWEINDLEIQGGQNYGVYITGNTDNAPLAHIHLTNLNVHGAFGPSTVRADSGEVFISAYGAGQTLSDVVVNGVTAHDSNVSEGIYVGAGGSWVNDAAKQTLGSNVTVENSTAHDVYGDGILIVELNTGLLQNNVVYNTGQCPSCGSSTPGGLWEWFCNNCTVQGNESYANKSWNAYDGGDFDIDYYNNNVTVQYNYGHDSAGYCIAFFGAESTVTTNSVFRYNVCSNNAQSSSYSDGEIFMNTWDSGTLNGVEIYNNTFYWNPAQTGNPMFNSWSNFSGTSPNFFENNIVYGAQPYLVLALPTFTYDHNLYWVENGATPQFQWNWQPYSGLAAYQQASGQEANSLFADPLLNSPTSHAAGMPTTAFTLQTGSPAIGAGTNVCTGIANCSMGAQDFFGNPLPVSTGYNIGAFQ